MSFKAAGDGPCRNQPEQVKYRYSTCGCVDDQIFKHCQATHQMWQVFDEFRKSNQFCDVVLRAVDGRLFPAHRLLLCTCGPYFATIFSGRWKSAEKEIEIPGINSKMMQILLSFIYTRELSVQNVQDTKELLIISSHLDFDDLANECIKDILENINGLNCLEFWIFARTYRCQKLAMAALKYSLKNIDDVVQKQAIWNLPCDDFRSLLDANELNISDEKIAFEILVRWIVHDFSNRQKLICQMLPSVRWGLLDMHFISKVALQSKFVSSCSISLGFMKKVLDAIGEDVTSEKTVFSTASFERNMASCGITYSHRYPRSIVVVIGGWCGNMPTNSTEAYEPRRKHWNSTTHVFPELLRKPRAYHAVVYLNYVIYVIGGFNGQTTFNACKRYDIVNKKWKQMCGMHKSYQNKMGAGNLYSASRSWCGYYSFTRSCDALIVYSISRGFWRCYVGATCLNGFVYAIGGSDGTGVSRLKSAEKFDPKSNEWTQIPDMFERRSDAGVCCLKSRIYAAGGFTGNECVFSVEYFDVDCVQWTKISPMRIARSGVCVVPYRGLLIVLGGFDGWNRLRTVEVFDPDCNVWFNLPPMITERSNFTACVVEGKLTVIGGYNGKSTCPNVEFFDDISQTISRDTQDILHVTDNLFKNRKLASNKFTPLHTNMSLLENVTKCRSVSDTKLRDIRAGKWRMLPNMSVSRSALSSCVISDLEPEFLNSIVSNQHQKKKCTA